jgi:hypothetical protein
MSPFQSPLRELIRAVAIGAHAGDFITFTFGEPRP